MVTFKKIKQTVTGKLLAEGECIAADSKPVDIIANGSKLFELDTGSWYFFNESGAEWVKSVRGGAGNITVDELTITENGTYTPEDEQHAFGPVIVNVPPPEGYISPSGYNNYDLISVQQDGSTKQFANANQNYKIHVTSNAANLFAPYSAQEVYDMLHAGASVTVDFAMGGQNGVTGSYIEYDDVEDIYRIYFHGTMFYTGGDTTTLMMAFTITYVVNHANITPVRAFLYQNDTGTIDARIMLASIDTAADITVPYLDGRGLLPYIKEYSDEQDVEYHYQSAMTGAGETYTGSLMDITNATDTAIGDCPSGYTFSHWSTEDGTRVDDIRDLIGTSYTYSESDRIILNAVYDQEDDPDEP